MKNPFAKNKKKSFEKKASEICLALCCSNRDEIKNDLKEYLSYAQYVEWCVHETEGSDSWGDEEFLLRLSEIRKWTKGKKLIVVYRGDEKRGNHLIRLAVGKTDFVDISYKNSEAGKLIRDAKKTKTKVILSYHDYDKMMKKADIAELYLKMENLGGDVLKIACMANEEADTYEILEGAAMYTTLKGHKPIIAIAMGEEGQVSRICAGDFGSVISYGCGAKATAPGQFNCEQLDKYIKKYYTKE